MGYKNDYVEFKPFLDIESIHLSVEQWPLGQGAGILIQEARVENHWVAPRSTQVFEYREFRETQWKKTILSQ